MRDLAAQERHMQQARKLDVIDEQRLPGQQPVVLIALDRGAEIPRAHGAAARKASAAAIMASTMFW